MYQIDNATAAATQPAPTAAGTPGFFTDGSAVGGVPATVVPAEWLNAVQMEMINTLLAAGLTPSKSSFNQLAAAIGQIPRGRLLRTTVYSRVGGVQMVSVDGGAPTTVGASTFNPLSAGKQWFVEVQSAGGGGAGAPGSSTQGSVSGGGGGGTYALALLAAVAGPIAVTVGAGGAGGVNTGSAVNGGASSFGALVTCPGGPASLTGVAGALLVGGTAQSSAATGANIYSQRGGGGVYGLQLSSTGSGVGGKGGSSHFGDGPNGPNQTTSNGVAAVNFGTGGSGATSGPGNTSGATGGAGADGIIIIRELSGP